MSAVHDGQVRCHVTSFLYNFLFLSPFQTLPLPLLPPLFFLHASCPLILPLPLSTLFCRALFFPPLPPHIISLSYSSFLLLPCCMSLCPSTTTLPQLLIFFLLYFIIVSHSTFFS